jgi:outer membrane protein assembly factor BamD
MSITRRLTAKLLALIFLTLIVGACASSPPEVLTEKEYYEKARTAMAASNFTEATEQLEALETYHPFGRYAQQAQLDLIYSRYNALDTDGAAAAADRFIKLHPDSPSVDYAWYIKGLSAYYSEMGMAVRFLPVDPTSRDIGRAREGFQAFATLVRNYPESTYAPDAEQRMIAIRNHLAANEMHVAQYYVRREAYVAALTRAQYVVENLPETPAVADALAVMVELYRELGMNTQAADALTVLAANFPEHRSLDADLNFIGGITNRESRDLSRIMELGLDN